MYAVTRKVILFSSEQIKDLESRLQKEIVRAEEAERSYAQLQDEHQAACDLACSKDQLVELSQSEISQLRESLAQATAQHEVQNARWEIFFLVCLFLFSLNFGIFIQLKLRHRITLADEQKLIL